jgi:hypothetical protein
MHTYHETEASAVSANAATSPVLERLDREADFLAGLRTLARAFLLSVPDLNETERNYLKDVAREAETRFPMKNVQRLCDFARRSRSSSHRLSFTELVRKHSGAGEFDLDLISASNRETEVQGKADVAVRSFEQHPGPVTKRLAVEAVRENLDAERVLLDAIEGTRVS